MSLSLRTVLVVVSALLTLLGVGTGCTVDEEQGGSARFTRVTSGAFVTDTASSPSASWADVDQDGDLDLYVLNGFASLQDDPDPQTNRLYRNDGQGTFTPLPEHPLVRDVTFSGSSVWGDYDNDGDADLFVANQKGADNLLYENEGEGAFTRIKGSGVAQNGGRSFSAVWVDIDGDGFLDLHVLNGRDGAEGEEDFLYRNIGDGTFERVTGPSLVDEALPSGGAEWADYDGDGDLDVALPIYSSSHRNRVYRNDGNWQFTEVGSDIGLTDDPLPYSPRSSVAHWIDVDNDLDLDLFFGNTGGTIDYLFENDGRGQFTKRTAGRLGLDATYVSDVTWGDFDNDADLDFVIAVWGGASEYYENDGSGAFFQKSAGELGTVVNFASSVSFEDPDSDGDLDLYLTHWPINEAGGEPNQFYRNDDTSGNWLKVMLEGTTSNRSGIGARVVVSATIDGRETSQLRQVRSRSSWRSASSHTRHFGLADAQQVDAIVVHWPSGERDRISGPVSANRGVLIKEGVGLVE